MANFVEPKRMYEKNVIFIPCECGHGILTIQVFDWGGEKDKPNWDGYLMFYDFAFSSNQNSFWKVIKDRVEFAWYALRGKKYSLYDVMLERKDLEKLRDELTHVLEME